MPPWWLYSGKPGRQHHDLISYSVTLSWHWANQPLPYPNNESAWLRKQQMSIFKSLVWLNKGSNLWHSTHSVIPFGIYIYVPIYASIYVCVWHGSCGETGGLGGVTLSIPLYVQYFPFSPPHPTNLVAVTMIPFKLCNHMIVELTMCMNMLGHCLHVIVSIKHIYYIYPPSGDYSHSLGSS